MLLIMNNERSYLNDNKPLIKKKSERKNDYLSISTDINPEHLDLQFLINSPWGMDQASPLTPGSFPFLHLDHSNLQQHNSTVDYTDDSIKYTQDNENLAQFMEDSGFGLDYQHERLNFLSTKVEPSQGGQSPIQPLSYHDNSAQSASTSNKPLVLQFPMTQKRNQISCAASILDDLDDSHTSLGRRSRSNSSVMSRSCGDEYNEETNSEVLSPASLKGCSRWMEREEIFLSGIVMDMYYRRHSLKPTLEEKAEAKRRGISCEMLVWQYITSRYNLARERFADLTGIGLPDRSVKSLQRHWKETGLKKLKEEEGFEVVPLSKKREQSWEALYNADNVLMCSDEDFQLFKASSRNKTEYRRKHGVSEVESYLPASKKSRSM